MFDDSLIDQLVSKVIAAGKFCGRTKVITIDGPAGSGKTTLAAKLSSALSDCPVVHMDDLYSGWNQDLHVELAHRITTEILTPISKEKPAIYKKYDWADEKFKLNEKVDVSDYLILEGVGAGHPEINNRAVLNIWIEANAKTLLDRLVRRDGEHLREQLVKWQTHEARYFEQLSVKDRADVVLSGD